MTERTSVVLLVDDEPNVTEGIIRRLRHEPYRLLSASSAQEALSILEKQPIDVLITDEQMPNMTGTELVSRARKAYPQVICMMLSGQNNFEAAIRAVNEGEIYRFLRKPCDPVDIATDIRLALERRDMIIQSRKLLDQYQKEHAYINNLKKKNPGLFDVEYDENGCIVVENEDDPMSAESKKLEETKKDSAQPRSAQREDEEK